MKREYNGPPIDGTEQYVGERNENGETIAGTTEDDLFDESADWLPRDMNESDFTRKQKQALRAYLSHSDRESATPAKIAENHDFSKETARRAIHKAFPNSRGIDDLTDSRRLAIKILAYEGKNQPQNKLAENYPLSMRAFGEAKRVYGDLVAETQPIGKDQLNTAVKEYRNNHPAASQEKSETSLTETSRKSKDEKEYPDDFSDTYKWFIEAIAENPAISQSEIKDTMPDNADFSPQNYYNVIKDYHHIIMDRIKQKGTADTKDDMSDYLAKHVESFGFDTSETEEPQPEKNADENNIDKRLRAVESKTESLRQEVNALKETSESTNVDLASVIIESLSDDDLGKVVREAITHE